MRRSLRVVAILAPLALLYGCSKAPAEAAINAAKQAVEAARPVAEKLVPDQMKSLTDALADAQDKFGKGDYTGALAASKDLPVKASAIVAAARAKKEQLTKTWEGLSKDVTGMVAAATAKVGELSAMKKLPKGMDKAGVESVRSSLDALNKAWTDASETFKTDMAAAIQKGGEVKVKAQALMSSLEAIPAAAAK